MNKRCPKCSETKSHSEFYKDKTRVDGLAGICKKCDSLNGKKYQSNIKRRLYRYKNSALKRGLDFNLSDEIFVKIFEMPCYYCGEYDDVGIDRLDNSKGYMNHNVKPCCKTCNYMKRSMTEQEFIDKCLLVVNKFNDVTTKPTEKEIQDILVAYKRRDAFATGNSGITLKRATEMIRELYE